MGRITRVTMIAAALLLTFATAPGAAPRTGDAEPTPTPTPRPTPTPGQQAARSTPVPGSLAAAARAARRRRTHARPSGTPIVITNRNLKEYAAKGSLTYASGGSGVAALGTDEAGGVEGGEQSEKSVEKKREFWRNKYKAQKDLIEKMKKRIEELNREIPGLWTQFYSWDDPAYRDGVIKPKLDKDLQESKELTKRLPKEEAKLDEILEQARRDGALPGWFRDLVD